MDLLNAVAIYVFFQVALLSTDGRQDILTMEDFLSTPIEKKVLLYIAMPKLNSNYKFW